MATKLKHPREIITDSELVRQGKVFRSGIGGGRWVDLDMRSPGELWTHRHDAGRELRDKLPREVHGEWKPAKNRPDPIEAIEKTNRTRLPQLVPIRMGRMAETPFGFFRGAAPVMAWDLSQTPTTGIAAVIDGDAHLNNFGLFGTPQRDVVFDLNDFDETIVGPWEYDLKRLTASIAIAGRENGIPRNERAVAVRQCVAGYRASAQRLERMGYLDVWYVHSYPGRKNPLSEMDPRTEAISEKLVARAARQTNASLLQKLAERSVNGAWRFREAPPILTRVDAETREAVIDGIRSYVDSLSREIRFTISRYHVVDVALRVVGVGSVGTRAYLAMLFGNDDNDPLFLQVKEASPPALGPYVPKLPEEYQHDGRRVVSGQRILQSSPDLLLGWTTIGDRPYYVRQFRNMKGSVPVEYLVGAPFNFYAWACGVVLARGHMRQGAGASIAGYLGTSEVMDIALTKWAERYAEQNERDHALLVQAIKEGRVEALSDV